MSGITKKVYCTACSVQTGKNKNNVYHENMIVTANNVKPTYKNTKPKPGEDAVSEPDTKKIIGYVAILECPITKRKISTFIEKSKAVELLSVQQTKDGNPLSKN